MAFQQIPHLQLENLAVQFNHDVQLPEEISTERRKFPAKPSSLVSLIQTTFPCLLIIYPEKCMRNFKGTVP